MVTWIRVFLSRAIDILLRRTRDERLSEEMQAHLDLLTDEYVAAGMSVDDARLAARRSFGGVDQAKRLYRDQRGLPGLDGLLQDVRFASRLLVKDPRFTMAAVVAIGLGIGVTNTVFTIVNTAILRDLPFDDPDCLVSLSIQTRDGRTMGVSYADFADWRASATTFDDLAAYAQLDERLARRSDAFGRCDLQLHSVHRLPQLLAARLRP